MSRKETRLATKEHRKHLTCRVYEMKVDRSKLSEITKKQLERLFLEGKWLFNHILSTGQINNFNTKVTEVPVLVKDKYETRQFEIISAEMKQAIQQRMFSNVKTLHTLKTKGKKAGRIRHTSTFSCIPLRQHHATYTVQKESKTIKIQKIKQPLKVYGLEQLPEGCEIANANFVKRDNDYFLYVTTFSPREERPKVEGSIGIDLGCSSQLTLSNGIKIEYTVPVTSKIKRLDRKIKKGNRVRSHNKFKDQVKRRKAYTKLKNTKKDIKNKIVRKIADSYKYVCFQDENIKGWAASGHGKKIQSTAIGGITEALKSKAHTPVEVDRFFASTQICPSCGQKKKLKKWERTYSCDCGYINDRDVKAAIMIEREGLKVPTERRNLVSGNTDTKPQETVTSTANVLGYLNGIPHVLAYLETDKQQQVIVYE